METLIFILSSLMCEAFDLWLYVQRQQPWRQGIHLHSSNSGPEKVLDLLATESPT